MISSFIASNCTNIFEPMSSTKTDSALLYTAKKQMNAGQWTEAIATFDLMTTAFLAQRDVITERAAAYAGRCGERFLPLLSGLSSLSGTTLFKYLFATFPAATSTQQADCIQAETLLKQIGVTAARNANENMLMLTVSLTKIGVILSKVVDLDLNGVLDAAFDPCDSTVPFDLSAVDAAELATGLSLFQASLVAVGGSFASDLSAVTGAISGVCGTVCNMTDISQITNTEQILIRSLVRDNENVGLGTNGCVSVASTPAQCAVCAGTYSTP